MNDDTINDARTIAGNGEGPLLANRYRIVRQLGAGGMGSVWLAEDTQLDDKEFAVKMLPSILVSNKRAYRQLKDEALVAMRLVHPNIVQIRAFEENDGNPFLVMDYIDGQTLDDYLGELRIENGELRIGGAPSRTGGSPVLYGLPETEVIRILKPIAAALDYAHAKGVVHRDVKPGNVMIAKDGTPYILDFGIAREIQETMTRVTGKLSSGTLLYMSPEQLMGEQPKPAQDVYSFAAMAYECLKGAPPFSHGQIEFQIMNKAPEPLVGVGTTGSLPVGVNGLAARSTIAASIMAGLAKKPEDRPKSCAGVLENHAAPQGGGTQVDATAGSRLGRADAPRPPAGPRSVTAVKGILAASLIAALAGGAWWFVNARAARSTCGSRMENGESGISGGAAGATGVSSVATNGTIGATGVPPAAPVATNVCANDPFRVFDDFFKGDRRAGGKAVAEVKVLRDLKVILKPSVPIAGEIFHMIFEFTCPSDVVLDQVQLKGLPDSGVVYGEASWLPDVPMNRELQFTFPALKSRSRTNPFSVSGASAVATNQLPAVVKRLSLPVRAMDPMETSVSASLSAMCTWKIGLNTCGTSVEERFPPTSIKVVGKTGYVTGHGAASKKVTAPCTADMVIEEGRTVELIEPCTDDVRVCSGSTLICRGICSGDVEIMKGGRFVCFGVMSGDILNHGGKVEIYGMFTGTRTDL